MSQEAAEPGKPKKIRAFVALKTPPEWDEQLAAFQERLKSELRSRAMKWVKPEQIHITLRFFGYILPTEVEEAAAALREACAGRKRFRLYCEGVGCFPNARRPRILWAGLSGDIAEVQSIQNASTEATRKIGEAPEARGFKPHLTLARIQELERTSIGPLERIIERGFKIENCWDVSEVLLLRSHLSAEGAKYEIISRQGLAD